MTTESENDRWLRLIRTIDEDEDIDVTSWEADFIETCLTQTKPLTQKQQDVVASMVEKYL